MGTEPVVGGDEPSEFSAKWGDKSVSAKSRYVSEIITVLSLCLLGLATYGGFTHIQESKEANARTIAVLEKMTERADAQTTKTVQAIREQTCISALPKDEQKTEFSSPHSWCKQITRMQ